MRSSDGATLAGYKENREVWSDAFPTLMPGEAAADRRLRLRGRLVGSEYQEEACRVRNAECGTRNAEGRIDDWQAMTDH